VRAAASGLALFVSGVAILAVMTSAATAQSIEDLKTGLKVTPPAGYRAELDTKSGFTARIVVGKQDDNETICLVDFQGGLGPELARLTQDQLNRMSRELDQNAAMKGQFEAVKAVEHLEHAGVVGAILTGNFTTAPRHSSILVIYYTTKGRSTVSCFTRPETFEARRADFVAVAKGITFPQ